MSHQRWHIIEKIQVEAAAVAALAAMYFLFWQWVKPSDVDGAVVFFPLGAFKEFAAFVAAVWLLAAGVALLTTSARPQGALLAALVGAGGVSLRSQPMRLLLMRFEPPGSLLGPLMLELLAMVVVLMGAMAIIQLVRRAVARVRPGWVRPDGADSPAAGPQRVNVPLFLLSGLWHPQALLRLPAGGRQARQSAGDVVVACLASLGLTVLIGLVLMKVILFDTSRGQILFSVAAAFFVGAAVATYFFPVNSPLPCWIAPVLLGLLFYAKAATVGDAGVLTWTRVDAFTHILPVDWLAAGCGGAVGGYWLACRVHEAKHAEGASKAAAQGART